MAGRKSGRDQRKSVMRRFLIIFAFAAVAAPVIAQTAGVAILPNEVKYAPLPFAPGVQAAWVFGGPEIPGIYTVRVRMTPGAKIPPHTHPDTRMVTILTGDLFAGLGTAIDPATGQSYPAGTFFTMPAGQPHYVWAKDGEVIYQESGNGPSPTALVK